MIHLITSLYNSNGATICPYDIFKFERNKKTNILDTDILTSYLLYKFPPTLKKGINTINKPKDLKGRIHNLPPDDFEYLTKMYLTFYYKGNYNLIDDKIRIPLLKNTSIFITPVELAYNIGITLPSEYDSFGTFEKKYKKYKMKYLKLKNSL